MTTKQLKFALVGNPNSGKTTLFNQLTGSTAHVGNWPGVTVERKEGRYRSSDDVYINIIDLPGIYSTSPYSPEEIISRDYVLNERPDVVIDIVDVTNIERNLYLTTQLMETDCPVVIALNMMDMAEKEGITVDIKALSEAFGSPVCPISASKGTGLKELMQTAIETAKKPARPSSVLREFNIYPAIAEIESVLRRLGVHDPLFCASKLAEGDDVLIQKLAETNKFISAEIEPFVRKVSSLSLNNDAEAAIADYRYKFITKYSAKFLKKTRSHGHMTPSDKIDRVLTNRILAIPIFILVMFLVFQLTFGEEFLGIPLPGVYLQGQMENLVGLISDGVTWLLNTAGAADWTHGLIVDGIIGGVGSVLSFLPQILMLFFFMTLLEASGYMARAAFIMDRLFRKFGLSGKSFVPLLMGFGCSVPALMASRTLENDKDRRLTMMLTPFMSCGAKMPIYAMFVAALFPNNQGIIVLTIYLTGIIIAIVSGIILKRTAFKGEAAPFIMELPAYRFPTLKNVAINLWEKLKHFLIKAGTLLLAATIVIWFLSNFNFRFEMVEDSAQSIIGFLGKYISYIFIPLGFGTWQAGIAVLTGFIAKEAVVSTLGVLYGAGEPLADEAATGAVITGIVAAFSPLAALSFMLFNLLAPPCLAAISTIAQEMHSKKWTFFTLGYQLACAWLVSFAVYQIGSLMGF